MNSRAKGAGGERELAHELQKYGYAAFRTAQFCGANGDADVEGVPGLHIECKRVERLNIHEAMKQSRRDAREADVPVVIHRKNRTKWLVTLDLDEFMKLWRDAHEEDNDTV